MSRLTPLGRQQDLLLPMSQPTLKSKTSAPVGANPHTCGLQAGGLYIDPAGHAPQVGLQDEDRQEDGIEGKC